MKPPRYAVLLAMTFAPLVSSTAQETITITATGTVSGYDTSGVFGTANSMLSGPFQLTVTVSPTNSTQYESCSGEFTCYSNTGLIQNAPALAKLSIGKGSYTFGMPLSSNATFVQMSVSFSYIAPVFLTNSDTYGAGVTISDGSDLLLVGVSGSSNPPVSFDWRSAFTQQILTGASTLSSSLFSVGNNGSAYGTLTLATLSEAGFSCTTNTPTVTIDTSATGKQPNILVSLDSTTVDVAVGLVSCGVDFDRLAGLALVRCNYSCSEALYSRAEAIQEKARMDAPVYTQWKRIQRYSGVSIAFDSYQSPERDEFR